MARATIKGSSDQMKSYRQTLMSGAIIAASIMAGSLLISSMSAMAKKPSQPASATYTIDQCVTAFDESRVTPTSQGFQFWFVTQEVAPNLNVKMSHVDGVTANHAPHQHPEEEVFYLLEGHAEFTLAGQQVRVSAPATLYCPAGVMHGLANVGPGPLRYLVIKNG